MQPRSFFSTSNSDNSHDTDSDEVENESATFTLNPAVTLSMILCALGAIPNPSSPNTENNHSISSSILLSLLALSAAGTAATQQRAAHTQQQENLFHEINTEADEALDYLIAELRNRLAILELLQSINIDIDPPSNLNQNFNVNNNNNNNIRTDINQTTYANLGLSDDLIPEAYLCSLMKTMMDVPVYDKTTQNRVEREAMVKALNNSQNLNPFNRQPLAIKALIFDSLLAERIKEFIKILTAEADAIKAMDEETQRKRINEIENILDKKYKAIVPVGFYFKKQAGKNKELTYDEIDVENFISKHGSPYKVLGISPKARTTEIESAYRKKARDSHSDKNSNIPSSLFIIQTKAKNLLIDQEKRALVDQYLKTLDEPNNQQQSPSKSCRIM